MKGRDRNSLCWCGSGKKYKKCHLDRSGQEKENPWAAVETNRRSFSRKECCAFDVGLGECSGGVIAAHTVSCGPNLSKIADDGHVLHYSASIPDMNRNGRKLSIKKIGIRNASVFYGFCAKHDRELFSCIENETFEGRADQCLAIGYRTLSRELYAKDALSHMRETLRGADKGYDLSEQVVLQSILNEIHYGNELARRELQVTHDVLTEALVRSSPERVKSMIFEFSGGLPFMFSGAWTPFTDLYGKPLQMEHTDRVLDQVLLSSFSGVTGGMICFSWLNKEDAPGEAIAEQIDQLPLDQQASSCLQLVVKHVENVFFNPAWFDGLSIDLREQLNRLAADGLDAMGSIASASILFDLDFRLPSCRRSFRV